MNVDVLANQPAIAATETAEVTGEVDANPVAETGADSAPAAAETGVIPERDKIQERIDKITREKYDALRESDYWRDRALRAQEPQAKPEPVAPAVAPTLEAHGYDEAKYQAALIEFAKVQAREEAKAILERERTEREAGSKRAKFEEMQAEFIKSKPDYAEKVLRNPSLAITQDMASVIMESELGPQVAYYLAENEDKARAIAQMPPIIQAREIGRIEARLEAAKAPPPKPVVSKAPPPTPKLDATEPAIDKDPENMSDTEFAKWRRRQIAQRR
jgi:hypothetical protein